MPSTCTVQRSLFCWAKLVPAGSKADIRSKTTAFKVKQGHGQDAKGTASPGSSGIMWTLLGLSAKQKCLAPAPAPGNSLSCHRQTLFGSHMQCTSASPSGQGSSPQAALSKLLAGESLHFSHCTLVVTHVACSLALHRVAHMYHYCR